MCWTVPTAIDVKEQFLSVKYVGLAFGITMDVWPLPFDHDSKTKELIGLCGTRKASKNVDARIKMEVTQSA
jgi:hypothetical protein